MPFFVGQFDLDSAQISGKWVRFATYPAGSVTGGARDRRLGAAQADDPAEVAVFGEVPWTTYTRHADRRLDVRRRSGLEHQNSHVDVLAPGVRRHASSSRRSTRTRSFTRGT